MLSARESAHCSVVRRSNPALSSLEEIEAFVFLYPAGFLRLMSLPFACLELSHSLTVTHLWHARTHARMMQTYTHTHAADNNRAVCLASGCHWEAQMPPFVQGLCMCTRVGLFAIAQADASVWGVLEMCPRPPISAALFAHRNGTSISIKPIPVTTCHEPLWAGATPLLRHLRHRDPRSLQVNGCHYLIILLLQVMERLPLLSVEIKWEGEEFLVYLVAGVGGLSIWVWHQHTHYQTVSCRIFLTLIRRSVTRVRRLASPLHKPRVCTVLDQYIPAGLTVLAEPRTSRCCWNGSE